MHDNSQSTRGRSSPRQIPRRRGPERTAAARSQLIAVAVGPAARGPNSAGATQTLSPREGRMPPSAGVFDPPVGSGRRQDTCGGRLPFCGGSCLIWRHPGDRGRLPGRASGALGHVGRPPPVGLGAARPTEPRD